MVIQLISRKLREKKKKKTKSESLFNNESLPTLGGIHIVKANQFKV